MKNRLKLCLFLVVIGVSLVCSADEIVGEGLPDSDPPLATQLRNNEGAPQRPYTKQLAQQQAQVEPGAASRFSRRQTDDNADLVIPDEAGSPRQQPLQNPVIQDADPATTSRSFNAALDDQSGANTVDSTPKYETSRPQRPRFDENIAPPPSADRQPARSYQSQPSARRDIDQDGDARAVPRSSLQREEYLRVQARPASNPVTPRLEQREADPEPALRGRVEQEEGDRPFSKAPLQVHDLPLATSIRQQPIHFPKSPRASEGAPLTGFRQETEERPNVGGPAAQSLRKSGAPSSSNEQLLDTSGRGATEDETAGPKPIRFRRDGEQFSVQAAEASTIKPVKPVWKPISDDSSQRHEVQRAAQKLLLNGNQDEGAGADIPSQHPQDPSNPTSTRLSERAALRETPPLSNRNSDPNVANAFNPNERDDAPQQAAPSALTQKQTTKTKIEETTAPVQEQAPRRDQSGDSDMPNLPPREPRLEDEELDRKGASAAPYVARYAQRSQSSEPAKIGEMDSASNQDTPVINTNQFAHPEDQMVQKKPFRKSDEEQLQTQQPRGTDIAASQEGSPAGKPVLPPRSAIEHTVATDPQLDQPTVQDQSGADQDQPPAKTVADDSIPYDLDRRLASRIGKQRGERPLERLRREADILVDQQRPDEEFGNAPAPENALLSSYKPNLPSVDTDNQKPEKAVDAPLEKSDNPPQNNGDEVGIEPPNPPAQLGEPQRQIQQAAQDLDENTYHPETQNEPTQPLPKERGNDNNGEESVPAWKPPPQDDADTQPAAEAPFGVPKEEQDQPPKAVAPVVTAPATVPTKTPTPAPRVVQLVVKEYDPLNESMLALSIREPGGNFLPMDVSLMTVLFCLIVVGIVIALTYRQYKTENRNPNLTYAEWLRDFAKFAGMSGRENNKGDGLNEVVVNADGTLTRLQSASQPSKKAISGMSLSKKSAGGAQTPGRGARAGNGHNGHVESSHSDTHPDPEEGESWGNWDRS